MLRHSRCLDLAREKDNTVVDVITVTAKGSGPERETDHRLVRADKKRQLSIVATPCTR